MRTPLIGSIVLALFIAETVHAQKYPIRLSPPDTVGQKNQISVTGSRQQQVEVTQSGRVLKSQSTNLFVIFEGREEILTLDGKGLAVRESCTVGKFTKNEDGVATVLLKPGSVILTDGSRDEENRIVLKGGVLDTASRTAFSLLMTPHRPNSLSDDDIYGVKEPKGVGDRWTINKTAFVNHAKEWMIIPIEEMTGVGSIISKGNFGGEDCLNTVTEVNADGVAVKIGPAGYVPESGSLQMTLRFCVPVNPAAKSRKWGGEMNSQVRVTGIPGSPAAGVVLETIMKQKVEMTSLPVRNER
jgi:hypothetical protein